MITFKNLQDQSRPAVVVHQLVERLSPEIQAAWNEGEENFTLPHVSSKRHILPYLIASLNMRGFKVQGGVIDFTEYVTLHQGTNPTLWVAINQERICGAFGKIQMTKDYTLETLLQEGTPDIVPFLSQEEARTAYPQAQIIGLSITESHAL